jgi:hypothetical protein
MFRGDQTRIGGVDFQARNGHLSKSATLFHQFCAGSIYYNFPAPSETIFHCFYGETGFYRSSNRGKPYFTTSIAAMTRNYILPHTGGGGVRGGLSRLAAGEKCNFQLLFQENGI